MSQVKCKKFGYEWIENEPPPKKLVSDGDILIKKLVENQRKTDITLEQHLTNPKQFEKGGDITPLSRYNPGSCNLSDILNSTKHFNNIEHLKAAGLTDQDAQLYIDSLKGDEVLYTNHKNWERSLLQEHLGKLKKLVQIHESKQSECGFKSVEQKYFSQYSLSIKPQSVETKLLKFVLENTKEANLRLSDPSINIKDLEKQCFQHFTDSQLPSIGAIRKKARKLQRRIISTASVQDVSLNLPVANGTSKWDIKTSTNIQRPIPIIKKKIYTCTPHSYYTIRNGEIVKLKNFEVSNKDPDVKTKLTLEEITQLPKFKDYSPGLPSKVLYLKNLSNSVKEEDLRCIFKKFGKDVKDYKVMKGRLRGQAFVTFEDESVAGKALEELIGTVLKNKPVIIQYSSAKK